MLALARQPLLRLLSLLGLFAALLGGCTSESTYRQAFIGLLQARIIDTQARTVPALTADEKKRIGSDYAKHYAVIEDFNRSRPQPLAIHAIELMREQDMFQARYLLQSRDALRSRQQELTQLQAALTANLAHANAAHAALKQPSSLKSVYAQAYDLAVTQRAQTIQNSFTALHDELGALQKLADFMESNQLQFSGIRIEAANPAVQEQLNPLLRQLQAHSHALALEKEKFYAVLREQMQ